MAYTEEELFDMSDAELAAAVAEERAQLDNAELDVQEDGIAEDGIVTTDDKLVEEEEELEQSGENENSADPEEGNNDGEIEDTGEPAVEDGADNPEVNEDDTIKSKEEKPVEVKKRKFKANGQEFEFTEQEMIEQFGKVFGQSMDYTKKMQTIAPYRKMISAFEDEGLKQEDMNLMIDALKGNKDAITSLIKRADVDVLDLEVDSESNYVPNDYGRNEVELKLQEVIDTIKDDQEFAITQHVVSNQWDEGSRNVFADNPDLIRELHIDVQNGTYDKVSPMATKLKVLDGGRKSDIDYYIEAGKQYHMELRSAELQQRQAAEAEAEQARLLEVQAQEAKRANTRQASQSRKAATIPKKRVSQQKVTDYLEDTDEAFDEWYKKLQESM